ncbi:MAG TPA: sn-glycerol-3-phosphate ABC transporter ATP-binding protein UgpC, partial [Pseudolabrys sp.]
RFFHGGDMAEVILRKVCKLFGKLPVVRDFSLNIADGEFLVLVGPSGCGKSTTLRLVAGLESLTSGEIYIGDRLVNDIHPRDRDIAMVFQNYALYPQMTVYDNMAFSLKMRKVPKGEIDRIIRRTSELLRIGQLLDRKPGQLSGGQRQRVALGRSIVRNPRVFLFDEPLSNLDAKLRAQMRIELKRLRERVATTSIYVTHDQIEAMTLGDRVVVMLNGRIQQAATPLEIYTRPRNRFVAGFIGSPAMNFITVKLQSIEDRLHAIAENFCIRVPEERTGVLTRYKSRALVLGVRPEHVLMGEPRRELGTGFDGSIVVTEQLGAELLADVRAAGTTVLASRIDPETALAPHQPLRLSLDPRGLHFFDIDSGDAIG